MSDSSFKGPQTFMGVPHADAFDFPGSSIRLDIPALDAIAQLPGVENARIWEPEPATVYYWGAS